MLGRVDMVCLSLFRHRSTNKIQNLTDRKELSLLPHSPEQPFCISDSDDTLDQSANRRRANLHVPQLELSDTIEFSSSAPEPRKKRKRSVEPLDLSDLDLPDFADFFTNLSQPTNASKTKAVLSEKSANLLSSLDQAAKHRGTEAVGRFKTARKHTRGDITQFGEDANDDILSTSPPRPKPTNAKKTKLTEAERAAKATDRAATRAAKDAEKELAKEQRRVEKERKALEKQKAADLAEVNKSRIDKKETTKEMLIAVTSNLRGTSVGTQIEAFMQAMDVELSYFDEVIDPSPQVENEHTVCGNIIKWCRKVTRVYNKELDHYTPLPRMKIEDEQHLLIYLTAIEFTAVAARHSDTVAHVSEAVMKSNLDAYIQALQRKHERSKSIIMIEGLNAFLRKNENTKSREFVAAARAANVMVDVAGESLAHPPSTSTTRRPKKRVPKPKDQLDLTFFTKELTDTLLLHLQLNHPNILIHHTATPSQSAHWIQLFTTHLSLRPYKLNSQTHTDAHAGFCMESGQIKTADTRTEIFVRMLQELPRITPSVAWGIVEAGFPGVRELVRGFRDAERRDGRVAAKEMLQDARKAVNRDGGVSERRLGPAVSRRLWRVFFGECEAVVDV